MPELPEVETYRRDLEPELHGRMVRKTEVFWPRTIAVPAAEEFQRRMTNQLIDAVGRRGKYLLFSLAAHQTLIVHLRMTGELHFHADSVPPDKHTHVRFWLDDNRTLHYRDMRKFGRMWLVADPLEVLRGLGPEPLEEEFQPDFLADRLRNRTASIKSLLLNQGIVAGVGNIYADEALFLSGIDPRRPGKSLSMAEVDILFEKIRCVLNLGIEKCGSSLQTYVRLGGMRGTFQDEHQVFRKTGEPCPRCGRSIQRIVLAQRSTHFCPGCQK